ncbi:cytochrome c oxidase assembly factor CtaG [Sporosarcina sp. FSL K6-1522]|uniref:cytochrome c oxidase assembly factor CtaG n=1 Tax=Sporosarcina sp. FSL K6-1522 TaxID=2921554 RepID=UPI00315AC927
MMPLSIFGFQALWSPIFLSFVVLGIVLYLVLAIKMRHRFEGSEPLSRTQLVFFLTGMVLLYIIKGSPVDLLGHILFSVHMMQMALLLLLVAPFLLMGIPNWMWKKVFNVGILNKILGLLTRPIIAILLFIGMFSIYHIPIILDHVKLSAPLHTVFTVTLFISALFFWWPIVNTMKGQPKLHGLKKIGYVILSAILITPACALIIFVDVPVYETYKSGEAWLQAMALCVPAGTLAGLADLGLSGPELFTNMPTVNDQQLGGILMKVTQEIIYVVVLGRVFIKWYKEEQENADEITQKDLLERQRLTMHGQ